MRSAFGISVCWLSLTVATACSPGGSWEIERAGERCESLEMSPGADGRVRVEGASFVPPEDSRPVSCLDDDGWLSVSFGESHGEQRHTLAVHFGVLRLDTATSELVTPENRQDMLWALAADCVARTREDPRCLDLEATPNDFALPGLSCVGWDEAWTDLGVPGAIGEKWPMQVRSALCFDPADPPTALVQLAWSERHAPEVDGLTASEVDSQSFAFLSTLGFEPE
jgi:hypothetical protein